MGIITCDLCVAPLRIQPDQTFACGECGHVLAPADINTESGEIWSVTPDGHLEFVPDTSTSLEALEEAVEMFLGAEDGSYGQLTALNDYDAALAAFLDTYQAKGTL